MAEQLKIEAGKFYKTRDGRKAFVAAMMPGNPFTESVPAYPFMGYVDVCGASWTAEGVYHIGHEASEFDLIAEWCEPRTKTVWLAWYQRCDGSTDSQLFHSKIAWLSWRNQWSQFKLLALREITLTEGEGLDA